MIVIVCVEELYVNVLINGFYHIEHDAGDTRCLCAVFSVRGCATDMNLSEVEVRSIIASYTTYDHLPPIHIGADLQALKHLMHHKEMVDHLKQLQQHGAHTFLTVHHSVGQIRKVLKRIGDETKSSSWWEDRFTARSGEDKKAWEIPLHPIGVILIRQVVMVVYLVIISVYVCAKRNLKLNFGGDAFCNVSTCITSLWVQCSMVLM